MTGFLLVLVAAIAGVTGSVSAAEGTGYVLPFTPENSTIRVDGTSTLHDWYCTAQTFSGSVQIQPVEDHAEAVRFQDLAGLLQEQPGNVSTRTTLPVKEMKCNKDGMNPKMLTALKAEKHPEITFEMTGVSVVEAPASESDTLVLSVPGQLTIAGTTREVNLNVQVKPAAGGGLRVTGSRSMKLTQFNIEPPTAMWGMIETYDDITVRFDVRTSAPEGTGDMSRTSTEG